MKESQRPGSVDWSGLRAAAIALQSVNEAARRASANLPAIEAERFRNRVNKRAYRERWLAQNATLAQTATVRNAKPMSQIVQTGSDTLANKLKEDGETTKTSLSSATKSAALAFAKKKGNAVIAKAKQLRDITATASQIHGWDTQRSGGSINLNILTGQAAVQISSGNSPESV